jgi:hypothetical protein
MTTELLAWVRNPVPISKMGDHEAFKCPAPQLPENTHICNGMPGVQDGAFKLPLKPPLSFLSKRTLTFLVRSIHICSGLLVRCPFNDFPFFTCYGCPVTPPTPSNPNPEQDTSIPNAGTRFRIPGNCSTVFWDPQEGKCLAEGKFQDQSRPIGVSFFPFASFPFSPFAYLPPASLVLRKPLLILFPSSLPFFPLFQLFRFYSQMEPALPVEALAPTLMPITPPLRAPPNPPPTSPSLPPFPSSPSPSPLPSFSPDSALSPTFSRHSGTQTQSTLLIASFLFVSISNTYTTFP